ncbi:uncharacterized protein KQ657_000770 [Scheffersomyces spartinae]|uniref:Uncharacterized protein n=1 Tax=Scheffersomyces spartinae TaxID=45513 RepID=A0A9P7V8P5_9ASCO|nr:uncharacterized protein KQ657_000770 [Scheffersomyces spartinae]KAG7193353.1 hypothetical protein KQ657_000770 [Scheffersomyces spartinae]
MSESESHSGSAPNSAPLPSISVSSNPSAEKSRTPQEAESMANQKASTVAVNNDSSVAPPASKDTTSGPKKKVLRRKIKGPNPLKKKIWLAGHASVIAFGILYCVLLFLRINKWYIRFICYRLSNVGSVFALGAAISHKYGLRYLPPTPTLFAQQDFQYLIIAAVNIISFRSMFKLLPFVLISLLHIGDEFKVTAITGQSTFLASLIAYDELFLIIYLVLRTLLFRSSLGFQLVVYLCFYWLRILYNNDTAKLFSTLMENMDINVSTIKNEKIQKFWAKAKKHIDDRAHKN